MLPLLFTAMACMEPTATSSTYMVGRLVSASSAPLVGIEIASLETASRTDDQGAFTVRYKEPSQHVHFGHGGVWYQRDYRAEDDGAVIELALPELRDATLHCGPVPCVAKLQWDLGEGFTAKTSQACEPGLKAPLRQIPIDTPEVGCTEGSTGPKVPFSFEDHGATLQIGAEASAVRVEIRAVDGGSPKQCQVVVGDRAASPAGDGFWSAEASGTVTVSASCDGIPARPKQIEASVGSVVLEWTNSGPTLDLEEIAPWLNTIQLVSEAGEAAGWTTEILESPDGTFSLPPLAEGRYRVLGSGQPDAALLAIQPPEPSAAGILAVRVDSGQELVVGRIDAAGDILEGTIPIERFK